MISQDGAPGNATRNIRLVLEYDGTNYHGWQSQQGSGRTTIQETLENAIAKLAGRKITTFSSGRTDAGVHALGHVANFHADIRLPPEAWAPALNHELPPDIRVLVSSEAPQDFHARFSAIGKVYRYRILNRRAPTALFRTQAWHVNVPLDLDQMQRAAVLLVGRHDFSAFRGSGCTAKSPVRSVRRIDVVRSEDFIDITFEADAFLQYMARNFTGTLVEVGLGRFVPDDITRILASGDRSCSGRTAPPQGLCLVRVLYP